MSGLKSTNSLTGVLGKALIASIAVAFGALTLWIIDTWIKYPLFVFELFAIATIYYVCVEKNVKISLAQKPRFAWLTLNIGLVGDIVLVGSAISLLLFNLFYNVGSLPQTFLTLLVTSILPGYALLNIFNFDKHFSTLEKAVVSFFLSFAFTGFLSFVFLVTSERTLLLLASYIVVGLVSAMKHKKPVTPQPSKPSLSRKEDILVLLLVVAFYLLSFSLIYPTFAIMPGTDISQHYGWSVMLNRAPDLYIGSSYLFGHLHESAFILLANPSIINFQMALLFLNLLLPLAFYAMAKSYLEKIDKRLPALSTIFWVIFSNAFGGFSWIYYSYLKLSLPLKVPYELLYMTAERTYNGTIYGILGLWYVPVTISFILLMTAVFLLRKTDISKVKFTALFSILIAVMYLTHVTEAVFLVIFIAIYSIISRNQTLKLDYALVGSLIGLVFSSITFLFLSQITARFIFNTVLLISIIAPVSLILLSLSIRHFKSRISSLRIRQGFNVFSFRKLSFLIIFAYIAVSLSFFTFIGGFLTSDVNELGIVPWFMYPIMLGITGTLSVIALYFIAANPEKYRLTKFFIAFMIFAFVAGVFVSIMNLSLFNVSYWEKRFVWFIKIPAAMLAPIPFVLLFDRLQKTFSKRRFIKVSASIVLIGVLCLSISTAFLNLEYWTIRPDYEGGLTNNEINALSSFSQILNQDPRAWVATVSTKSLAAVSFAAPADTLVLRQLLFEAHSPELALTLLYRSSSYSHPYVYMHTRDWEFLNDLDEGHLLPNFLRIQPVVFQNSEVTIYNVSKLSYPEDTSRNTLIIPFEPSVASNYRIAYNILSYGLYNYTVAYDADHNALKTPVAMLSFDPLTPGTQTQTGESGGSVDEYLAYLNSGGKLIVLNTNGYTGFFSEQMLTNSTSSILAEEINGLATIDWSTPIPVEASSVKDTDVSVLSKYQGGNGSVPFILEKNYSNGGQLYYVNVYPLTSNMPSIYVKSTVNVHLLGELLDGLSLDKITPSQPFNQINGYMTAAYVENATRIESSSILFLENLSIPRIFVDVDNMTYEHTNVSKIQLNNYSKIVLISYAASISSGTGFYSRVEVPSDFYLAPIGEQLSLTFVSNGKTITYNNVSFISFKSENATQLLLRIPTVSAYSAYFNDMYLNNYGQLTTDINGQHVQTTGFTQFTVSIGDIYNALSNVTLGNFKNDVSTLRSNYLSTITTELMWFSVIAPICAISILIINRWQKQTQVAVKKTRGENQ